MRILNWGDAQLDPGIKHRVDKNRIFSEKRNWFFLFDRNPAKTIMDNVLYKEIETEDPNIKIGILIYQGSGDPVMNLNAAVRRYVRNENYQEFIDANMDNPWVRVIIKGVNDMSSTEFDPVAHRL